MKTKEEIFKSYLRKMKIAKNPPVTEEELDDTIKQPDMKFLFDAMQEYTDQETESMREQLKEKDDRIEAMTKTAQIWIEQLQSQSTLIESLAGALNKSTFLINKLRDGEEVLGNLDADFDEINKARLQYDNFKKKENGKS